MNTTSVSPLSNEIAPGSPENISKVTEQIFKLAFPAIGERFLHIVISLVDMAFVGRLGAEGLAVTGLSWYMFVFFLMPIFALNVGSTAVISRYIGSKDEESARRAVGQSILLNFFITAVGMLLVNIFVRQILLLMGTGEEILSPCINYVNILNTSLVLIGIVSASNSALRAAGDTVTPMKIMVIQNILNIFLDYAMIFGKFGFPAWGVMGSAAASAIVFLPGAILTLGGLLLGRYKIKIQIRHILKVDWEIMNKIVRISFPSLVEYIATYCIMIFIFRIINGLGTIALAITNLVERAQQISIIVGAGFSTAAAILTGQALGEKNPEKAKTAVKQSGKIAVLLTSVIGFVMFLFPGLILKIFTNDSQVILKGADLIRIFGIMQPIAGLNAIFRGALSGAGDTKTIMLFSMIDTWVFWLPTSYLLTKVFHMGLIGVWIGALTGLCFFTVAAFIRYKSGKWAKIKI